MVSVQGEIPLLANEITARLLEWGLSTSSRRLSVPDESVSAIAPARLLITVRSVTDLHAFQGTL
jgi:hypothetical protein